jgi:hypothetical protein
MQNANYKEFVNLVLEADGVFSYRFGGKTMICDPCIFIARNCKSRASLEAQAAAIEAKQPAWALVR